MIDPALVEDQLEDHEYGDGSEDHHETMGARPVSQLVQRQSTKGKRRENKSSGDVS